MRSGKATITAPISLVQATGEDQGAFLILSPIFRPGTGPKSPDERAAVTFGWAYTPIAIREVLSHFDLRNGDFRLVLSDVSGPGPVYPFFESALRQESRQAVLSRRIERDVFGRRWRIDLHAQARYLQGLNQLQPNTVLMTGALTSLLLAALVAAVRLGRQRERENAAKKALLAASVDSSTVAIIAETLEGRITSWNRAAETVFGYSAEKAIGQPSQILVPPQRRPEAARVLADLNEGRSVPAFDTVCQTKWAAVWRY